MLQKYGVGDKFVTADETILQLDTLVTRRRKEASAHPPAATAAATAAAAAGSCRGAALSACEVG